MFPVGMVAVAKWATVVTMTPAMMRVRLKASAERSSEMPSVLRFFFHQRGSVALSMLVKAPTARKATRTTDSSIGVMLTAERNTA